MEDLDMNKISLEAGSSDYGAAGDNDNFDDGGNSGTTDNTNLAYGNSSTTEIDDGGNSGTTENTNLDGGCNSGTTQNTNVDGGNSSTTENTNIEGGGNSGTTENTNLDGGGNSGTTENTNLDGGCNSGTTQNTNVDGGNSSTTENTNIDGGGNSGTTDNTNLGCGNSSTTENTNLKDGGNSNDTENTNIDGGGNSGITENTNLDGGGSSGTTENTNVDGTQIERKPDEYERCEICFKNVNVNKMHEKLPCHHRFCIRCMANYVEFDLKSYGSLPRCPLPWCASPLPKDVCEKFLSPELLETFSERLEEAAIPDSEKVYCPYPNCSALMSLSTLERCPQDPSSSSCSSSPNPFATTTTAAKCQKCNRLFCIQCRAPWHKDMTCDDYASQMCGADAEFNLLAAKNKWKQCPNCKRVIERTSGCMQMCCRCGCEFCYQCGCRLKNKEPCNCDYDDSDSDDDNLYSR